jgi:hypothetical protein
MGTRSSRATGGALRAGLIAVAVLACAASAGAEMDHLTGYKVKEGGPALSSTHALQDALGSGNCTLKKAKFYLTGAEKDVGDDPRGGTAGDYICYTAKCELPEPVLPLKDDQLGPHALAGKKVKLVCLPAVDDGCPGGAMVAGSCWKFGSDCDSACTSIGKTCDEATTANYAGSGGTNANCDAVISALAPGAFGPATDAPCGEGVGCGVALPSSAGRCVTPATTCAAVVSVGQQRVCACQ